MSKRRKNFIKRELDYVLADLKLWRQKRRDRSAVRQLARELLAKPQGTGDFFEEKDKDGDLAGFLPAKLGSAVSKGKSRRARFWGIGWWHSFRLILRRRFRLPFVAEFLIWSPILAVSITLTMHFLKAPTENASSQGALSRMTNADDFKHPVQMNMSGIPSARFSIAGDLPDGLSPNELMHQAHTAFVRGNYREAEKLYRQALPFQKRKPVVLFRIFLCTALDGRMAEANDVLKTIPAPPLWNSPANFYARGVLAQLEGKPEEAKQLIHEGRLLFPLVKDAYDIALCEAGFYSLIAHPPTAP